jgi:hypothetical protein
VVVEEEDEGEEEGEEEVEEGVKGASDRVTCRPNKGSCRRGAGCAYGVTEGGGGCSPTLLFRAHIIRSHLRLR